MGGSPTNYPIESNPQKEAATYERLQKQGMSDQGIVAPEQIWPALKSFGSDLEKGIEKKFGYGTSSAGGSPNSFGRDASKPAGQDK
jgi:hypothetical protein